ncbi:MAG: DUF3857 domain-containing protein [Ignavibacteria bacterium]
MFDVLRRCGAVLLALVAFGAAAATAEDGGIAVTPAPAWLLPPQVLPQGSEPHNRNGPLVYLARDTQLLLKGTATERYEYYAYRINQPAALNSAGTGTIAVSGAVPRAAIHVLRHRRGDEVVDLAPTAEFRVLNQESNFSQGILIGNRTAVAQVPDLRVGDILEYGYTLTGHNPVFGDRSAVSVLWNSVLPIAARRLRVIEPPGGVDLRVTTPRGAEALDVRRSQTAEGREILVQARDLPIARLEPGMPAAFDPYIAVALTPYASWAEVGRWAEGLFRADAAPSAAYAELLARLKKMPKRAAVAEAVRFVQDDIRYFSVSIGENSHRPYPPAEVVARRYGDCKDKSLLLSTLLRDLGLEARPALTSISRRAGVARFPPMPNIFDHTIAWFRFEGREYWIDPTRASAGAAFDKQGVAFAGSKALLVGGGDAVLSDIPESGANGMEVVETAEMPALDGPVAFAIETRMTGAAADAERKAEAQRGRDASERALLEVMARRYTDVKAAKPPRVRDEDGVLTISESYELRQFLRAEGHDKKLAPLGAQQLMLLLGGNGQRERIYPFAIPAGRGTFRYQAVVNLPPTVAGREDPVSNAVSDEHFRLTATRSFRGSTMRFSAELVIMKSEVAPGDFGAYLDKVKQAREALLDFVLLSPENLMTGSTAQPGRVAERMKRDNRALADELTRAIDSGRLADNDAADAYYKRGVAHMMLPDDRRAMDDFNAALRLRPFFGAALSDRGLVHLRNARLVAAEEDLSRAITLGAEPSMAYVRRGQVRFLGGRYAEALADFQQAQRGNAHGVNRDFIDIWQALAMRAQGQDTKAAFAQRFVGDDRRRWPMPILSLLMGDATAADVLRAAESRSADERDANLCEANFYIGQLQLLGGNRRAAAESFRASLGTGVTWFQEYDLAQVVAARLKAEGP